MGKWTASRTLLLGVAATVIVLIYLASITRQYPIHQAKHESPLVLVYNRVLSLMRGPQKYSFSYRIFLYSSHKPWPSHRSIPKTGSTTVMSVIYKLTKRNSFRAVLLNVTKNQHTLSLQDQWLWARNLSSWIDYPTLYHGHIAYLNFDRSYDIAQLSRLH